MKELIKFVEQKDIKEDRSFLRTGQEVRVWIMIKEGDKKRLQPFEGTVVAVRGERGGTGSNFTVRKISYGVTVEKIFPLHSPSIGRIEVLKNNISKKAKL